jgi:hypothetical protein
MCTWQSYAGESCAFEGRDSNGILIPKDKESFMAHGEWKIFGEYCPKWGASDGQHCKDTKPSYKELTRDIVASMSGDSPSIVMVEPTPRLDEDGNNRRWNLACQRCKDRGKQKGR